ncbi:winged helix-turn-helix domain-containing protein [Planomonospora sp. ID91781]|uniref:AfsR/SARP family transcriptional regulator n=1 Tax=Planomonospora sp. ID91781 TaxID=2738135 RepID=UPI0018C3BAB2|nr:BTAD domain-containing putative transcriptional regulator [Planomonospora sp. ID91781]MBG0824960.1 winged helix-turn-helix domain-containing protein [Planomonospora sp. ID91781]
MTADETVPVHNFQVLGPLRFTLDGVTVALPARHPRMLLAVLLLHNGEAVAEGRLLEQVWGPGASSTIALRTAVSRLRSWLHDEARGVASIDHADGGYRLRLPDHYVDAARFRAALAADSDAAGLDPHQRMAALMNALEEWRGPVLDGAPEEIREDPAVQTLDDDHATCLQRLAALAISLQTPDLLLSRTRALAWSRPFDEPLHARLIELYAACGRPAEALMEYERLRSRLADELGVAPSAEVQRAYFTVLAQDPPQPPPADPASGKGWRHRLAPRQIPADIADFAGREKATATLLDHLGGLLNDPERPATLVAGVTGPAGVGKTTLAVHVAHRLMPAYPDGQLYADLRGTTAAPESPARVLGRFLRALGVGKHDVPDDLAERTALYRSLVSGRRLLVVLDDAARETQVRPLLPGSSPCSVLITSRHRMGAVGGAKIVDLDRLREDHAVQLLASIAGHERVAAEPDAAVELVHLCGGLPLAVRICGARLAARPHWPLVKLVALLRDERRRLGELSIGDLTVRDGLEQSHGRLGEEARRTLSALAKLGPVEFSAGTVAAVCGLDHTVAGDHLDTLVEAGFASVVGSGRAGQVHYRLDDLARSFALGLDPVRLSRAENGRPARLYRFGPRRTGPGPGTPRSGCAAR